MTLPKLDGILFSDPGTNQNKNDYCYGNTLTTWKQQVKLLKPSLIEPLDYPETVTRNLWKVVCQSSWDFLSCLHPRSHTTEWLGWDSWYNRGIALTSHDKHASHSWEPETRVVKDTHKSKRDYWWKVFLPMEWSGICRNSYFAGTNRRSGLE